MTEGLVMVVNVNPLTTLVESHTVAITPLTTLAADSPGITSQDVSNALVTLGLTATEFGELTLTNIEASMNEIAGALGVSNEILETVVDNKYIAAKTEATTVLANKLNISEDAISNNHYAKENDMTLEENQEIFKKYLMVSSMLKFIKSNISGNR